MPQIYKSLCKLNNWLVVKTIEFPKDYNTFDYYFHPLKWKGNNIGYGMNPLLTTIRKILKRFRLEENTICKSFDILVPKVIPLWPLIKRSFSTQLCKKLFIPSGKNYWYVSEISVILFKVLRKPRITISIRFTCTSTKDWITYI